MQSLMDRVHQKCHKPVPSVKLVTDFASGSDSLCEDSNDDPSHHQIHAELLRDPEDMTVEERVGAKKRADVEEHAPDMKLATQLATANGLSLSLIKELGKKLGLAITESKRPSCKYRDRISFGLPAAVQKLVAKECNATPDRKLFRFTGTKQGQFFASRCAMTMFCSGMKKKNVCRHVACVLVLIKCRDVCTNVVMSAHNWS